MTDWDSGADSAADNGGARSVAVSDRWPLDRRPVTRIVVALALAWLLAIPLSLLGAYRDLQAARALLLDARDELGQAELSSSHDDLSAGTAHAASAATHLARPWITTLHWIPLLDDDLRAAGLFSAIGRDTGLATEDLLTVAGDIVHEKGHQADLGEINLDHIRALTPPLKSLSSTLDDAVTSTRGLACGDLVKPLSRACGMFLDVVEPAAGQVGLGLDLARLLPDLLGGTAPRHYLVLATTWDDMRVAGGLAGPWTVLSADHGVLDFDDFQPIAAIDPELQRTVAQFAPAVQGTGADIGLPIVAQAILDGWQPSTGPTIDGVLVLALNSIPPMVDLLRELEVPGVGTITPPIAERVIHREPLPDGNGQLAPIHPALAAANLHGLFEVIEQNDVPGGAALLQALVRDGDLAINVRDDAAQAVLARAATIDSLPGG